MIPIGTKIDTHKVRFTVVKDALKEIQCTETKDDNTAMIVWWDGYMPKGQFFNLLPHQRINRIPGMDNLCYKSTTFAAFNKMKNEYPDFFNFFPSTYLLPGDYSMFKKEADKMRSKSSDPPTWIYKPRAGQCGIGIKIFQNADDVSDPNNFNGIVQSYISPHLIDGFKYDFRFYLFIPTTEPYTVYMYKEGLTRFCTQQYVKPTMANMEDHFIHLTNTSVNVKNKEAKNDYLLLASEVLQKMGHPEMWDKIKRAAMLSMVAQYHQIVDQIDLEEMELRNAATRDSSTPPIGPPIDAMHRYFHLVGIDILIDEKLEPIVLEMNDRPSMFVTFDIERDLKKNLVKEALGLVSLDGTPPPKNVPKGKWEMILPVQDDPNLAKNMESMMKESLPLKLKKYASNTSEVAADQTTKKHDALHQQQKNNAPKSFNNATNAAAVDGKAVKNEAKNKAKPNLNNNAETKQSQPKRQNKPKAEDKIKIEQLKNNDNNDIDNNEINDTNNTAATKEKKNKKTIVAAGTTVKTTEKAGKKAGNKNNTPVDKNGYYQEAAAETTSSTTKTTATKGKERKVSPNKKPTPKATRTTQQTLDISNPAYIYTNEPDQPASTTAAAKKRNQDKHDTIQSSSSSAEQNRLQKNTNENIKVNEEEKYIRQRAQREERTRNPNAFGTDGTDEKNNKENKQRRAQRASQQGTNQRISANDNGGEHLPELQIERKRGKSAKKPSEASISDLPALLDSRQ